MKVVVDLSLCDLHGLCVEAAPEVFEIGDDGALHVLIETPPDGLRASVGIVTLEGVIDEDVVAPQVIAAAREVAERMR